MGTKCILNVLLQYYAAVNNTNDRFTGKSETKAVIQANEIAPWRPCRHE